MAEYMKGINPDYNQVGERTFGIYPARHCGVFQEGHRRPSPIGSLESSAPTYVQLERLADKFKRPIALFFFPEVPEEPDLVNQLALRSSEIEALSPDIRLLLRHAVARQVSLMELNMGVNPAGNENFSRPSCPT